MPSVSIARCRTYATDEVNDALEQALAPLGGIGAFVGQGQRVLLKVNLLSRAVPDRAVTTHPEVVRAAIRQVSSAGGVPIVGDSPGGRTTAGSAKRIFEASGLADVCAEEKTRLVYFDADPIRVPTVGHTLYSAFTVGREVVDADAVVSVAKLKTHGFMMFTGAVKNLFGCIPGLEKAQYHLKVPDRDDFASMLLDLMGAVRPRLAIMDGVVGMEGQGPAGGRPREIGALLASADLVALDVVASAIAGFDPMAVYTNRVAAERGLGPRSLDEVEVLGVPWGEVAPSSFEHPPADPFRRMSPALARRLRSWTSARPYLMEPGACTGCATCRENCPVDAIVMDEDRRPLFDDARCIRCYCCHELCPPQALGLKAPWYLRALLPSARSPR